MITHVTTVHSPTDTRVRMKELSTLGTLLDAELWLFVQYGRGDEADPATNIRIIDTGRPRRLRVLRMTLGSWRMYRALKQARPTVVHFHDPELIPVGLLMKLDGCKVVYDVHEDVPRQLLSKAYIPLALRRPLAAVAEGLERVAAHVFDAIVPATPAIAKQFPAEKVTLVQNFPFPDELVVPNSSDHQSRRPDFAYVGAITRIRGIHEMIAAMEVLGRSESRLRIGGNYSSEALKQETEAQPGWRFVDFIGFVDRPTMASLLGNVRAGLVLFHPLPNHTSAQPNKLFEYMATGLPIIASDFPLWREIVEGAGAGLLVDPLDPKAIAAAMAWILDHPEEAEEMGRRGQEAVRTKFNWAPEGEKLVALYERLLKVEPSNEAVKVV